MWRSLEGSVYLGCCQRQRFAQSFLRLWIIRAKARIFESSAAVDEIIHRWESVVSTDSPVAFSFFNPDPSNQGGFAARAGCTPTLLLHVLSFSDDLEKRHHPFTQFQMIDCKMPSLRFN